jgi:hypothetical protein
MDSTNPQKRKNITILASFCAGAAVSPWIILNAYPSFGVPFAIGCSLASLGLGIGVYFMTTKLMKEGVKRAHILLMVLGAVFLFLLAIIGAFLGFSAYRGVKLDASSKQFVETNIPPIFQTWSEDKLMGISSPEFKSKTPFATMETFFMQFRKLGSLKDCGAFQGSSYVNWQPGKPTLVTATYSTHAIFQDGEADFKIRLIQHDNTWQLLGFYISHAKLNH